jgi:hypothetical protein
MIGRGSMVKLAQKNGRDAHSGGKGDAGVMTKENPRRGDPAGEDECLPIYFQKHLRPAT